MAIVLISVGPAGWTPADVRRSAPTRPCSHARSARLARARRDLASRLRRACGSRLRRARRPPGPRVAGWWSGEPLGRRLLGRIRLGATVHDLPEAPADDGADDGCHDVDPELPDVTA